MFGHLIADCTHIFDNIQLQNLIYLELYLSNDMKE